MEPLTSRPEIVGIVNITADSFSDGGKFLDANAAIEHAKRLLADGADVIELGAASSNIHSAHVSAEIEIERLRPVLAELQKIGCAVSIDSTKTEVLQFALKNNVAYVNDIRGFPDESLYPALARSPAKLVVMHCISDIDKAVRAPKSTEEVFDSIYSFFDARLPQLRAVRISDDRIIMDPGMGFFLASNPEPSLAVLAETATLRARFGLPIMISVSRKSFLKNLATPEDCLPAMPAHAGQAGDIGTRTLAAELFAASQRADYIRTHDVRALSQGLKVLMAIGRTGSKKE